MTKATSGKRFNAPRVGPIPDEILLNPQYVWSPKLNGHRAFLSPSQFISRNGRNLSSLLPPTVAWPLQLSMGGGIQGLEGELVMTEHDIVLNDLGLVSSVVSSMHPHPNLRFFVFDAAGPGPYAERIAKVRRIFDIAPSSFIQLLPQYAVSRQVKSRPALIKDIVEQIRSLQMHAEGFVLRDMQATYEDPKMYKMLFLTPHHLSRVSAVRILPDAAMILFPDGSQRQVPFTVKARQIIHGVAANMPDVSTFEVVYDSMRKKIVGIGTDWL